MIKLALVVLTLCAAAAYAGTASVVASFRSPSPQARGIDYHDGYIYNGDGASYIYQTTTTGSVITSYYVGNASWGIDRTDNGFWACNLNGGYIFQLSTTGSFLRSFKGPVVPSYDVTYDDSGQGFLWISGAAFVYKTTTGGSVIGSFRLPTSEHRGICWDKPYLWTLSTNRNPPTYEPQIYQINQSGSVVDSFSINYANLYGVTWDGVYLWFSANNWIHKARVGFTDVEPASLGKVKAVYR